jgi:uncharacterized membrane protein YqjE
MAATHPPSASSHNASDPSPDQPLAQLVARMTSDLSALFRKEVELAKIEIREEMKQTAKASGMYGAAGFAGYMALVLVSLALAFLLDLIMPTWIAFLIVGVAYGAAGYLLFRRGQERFKAINPLPEQTIETIKEDVEWVRTRNK